MLFQHRPSGHFFGSLAVAARPPSALFDVLVLALLLAANAAQMLPPGHDASPLSMFPSRVVVLQVLLIQTFTPQPALVSDGLEISATVLKTFCGSAWSARSAWATIPIQQPWLSTTGTGRTCCSCLIFGQIPNSRQRETAQNQQE
jgi:hypothetical protein